jgi:hypothetical protein
MILRAIRALAGDAAAVRVIERRAPAAAAIFDRDWYVRAYPDVLASGADPLVHYMVFGAPEGRSPHPLFDPAYYTGLHPEARRNPLVHYAETGAAKRYATHPAAGFRLIPPLGRPLRVLTLLARYGTAKYPAAEERLEDLLHCMLPGAERRTVIIDNALPDGTEARGSGRRTLIAGDNTSWEFSAWDRGIEFAGDDLDRFDFIHFATDAFEQFNAEFPSRFDTRMLEALRFGPCAAGHIDFYNEPAELFGRTVQSWIRSSFFFVRPREVRALGSMVSVTDRAALFSGDLSRPFRPGSGIGDRLASYLTGWLTGEGTGQGVAWHSRFDLTEATLPFFEAKATAILNELMLTERLRSLGCWMADATWMRGVLDGTADGKLFEENWRDQITRRAAV